MPRFAAGQHQADAQHQREEHHRKDGVVRRGLDYVVGYDLDQHIQAFGLGRAVADDALRAFGAIAHHAQRLCAVHADARLDPVDQQQTDQHRDRRQHRGVAQRAPTDATERADIAHLADADHQRRKQQRNDEHEDQTQENGRERVGTVVDEVAHPLRIRANETIDDQPKRDAHGEADRDFPVHLQARRGGSFGTHGGSR
jgi:hypothetical protein